MTKYLLFLLPILLPLWLFASEISIEHATEKPLGKMIQTNAQITQLSNQKQNIVSRLSGHLEAYYIKPGEKVSKGDKIVLIESTELSKMTAEYLALIKKLEARKTQKNTAMTLHKKGLASQNDVSNAIIALENIRSQKNTLASQLSSLGFDSQTLKEATDQFVVYAHADGIVGTILVPLHSNVDAKTVLATLVNRGTYYATAFLSVDDAMLVSKDTKGWVHIVNKSYASTFVQLLPNIDQETQRAKILFSIDTSPKNILLGAFKQIDISLAPRHDVVMVKKSALTLFQGEWVVFVPTKHKEESVSHEGHGHDEHVEEKVHDEHEGHGHDTHVEEKSHDLTEKDAHAGHGHGDEEEEEAPYKARVVETIAYVGEYVAVKGIKEGEEYVSDGVYFVKSMLLRSSLGGHGH